jgi:hypothetical protein
LKLTEVSLMALKSKSIFELHLCVCSIFPILVWRMSQAVSCGRLLDPENKGRHHCKYACPLGETRQACPCGGHHRTDFFHSGETVDELH